jgi:predicted PurR-regulated permease PerM
LYPIYAWFERRKLPSWLASFLTVLFFVIVLCGPLLGIGKIVFNQAENAYRVVLKEGGAGTFLDKIETSVNKILPKGLNFNAQEKAKEFLSSIGENVGKVFASTFSAFFSFLLILLVIFYALKEGTHFKRAIKVLSPLSDKDDDKIIQRLEKAINGVIKGYLLIALIQGFLMSIGLWIFGVPNPALWGVITAVASLLPTIGTSLVSIPAIIYLFAMGENGNAIGLIIWATTLVGTIDNLLSPLLVSHKTNVPSFLILFSVLGGISFLGPVGILVGPLTVSLLYTLISIYRNEYRESSI